MPKMEPKRRKDKTYEVGWGRPPQSTRWKPGKSGNPKGRPKGAKNLTTIFDEMLQRTIPIRENDRIRWITVQEAMVLAIINRGLKGDIKAAAYILAQEPKVSQSNMSVAEITSDMTPTEAANAYARLLKQT